MIKKQVLLLTIVLFISSCNENIAPTITSQISTHSETIFEEIVTIRRDLHKHPELSGKEERTAAVVSSYLKDLGLQVHTNIAGHGVIGILNPHKKGKKIGWRADMDAIPYGNTDVEVFKSINDSIGHMCGHDVHTAIGLGIANSLNKYKDQIDGSVYFIFQPSEETFKGAQSMMENEVVDLDKLDEIYGLHIFPTQTGSIYTKKNELFAYERTIEVVTSQDVNKEQFINDFNTFTDTYNRQSTISSPTKLELIVHNEMGIENPETIYKDFFFSLQGINVQVNNNSIAFTKTFFETQVEQLDKILNDTRQFLASKDYGSHIKSVSYSRANPTVVNDAELTEQIVSSFLDDKGNTIIKNIYGQVPYFNEDFIYYQQEIPGVLFFLGASNLENDIYAMPHSSNFKVDEQAIKDGVSMFSRLLVSRASE